MQILKHKWRSLTALALLTLGGHALHSQTEATLSMMDNVYQSSYYSPFNQSEYRVSIGLPVISSVQFNVINSGFAAADLYPNGLNAPIDPTQAFDDLRDIEYVAASASVDLFHIALRGGNNAFSFHIKDNIQARFSYASDYLNLGWKGNGAFVGQEIDLSGTGFDFQHYREYALGYARQMDKWNFSGRGKLLFGKLAAQTQTSDLTLTIDDDIYQTSVSGDYTVNFGGFDLDRFENVISFQEAEDFVLDYLTNVNNIGLGLDLGVSYDYSQKLQLNAALTDLGFINWKDEPNNFQVKSDIAFVGLDAFDILYNNVIDSLEQGIENYIDSLLNEETIEFDSTRNNFRTSTPWNLALGARYEVLASTYLTARMNISHYNGIRGAFTLGVYHDFYRWLNVGLTNTVTNGKLMNVGAALVLKPGAFQIYMASDFITAAQFMRAQRFNFRFGTNLVFGRIKSQEKITSVLD